MHFLPFPSNLIPHFFVVFFSSDSLHSSSALGLPDHPLCFLSLVWSVLFFPVPPCSLWVHLVSLPFFSFYLPLSFLDFIFPPSLPPLNSSDYSCRMSFRQFLGISSLWVSTPTHVHTDFNLGLWSLFPCSFPARTLFPSSLHSADLLSECLGKK